MNPPHPPEVARRHELRQMQRKATGLLAFVSVAFVALTLSDIHGSWVGYVSATLEASMVGGVADWFAVTAIFRRPLGLPIPHTAVIAGRKDQFGRTLARFVQQNFLTGEVVADRIVAAGVVGRLGNWMASPRNAARVADRLTQVLDQLARTQDPNRLSETAVRALAAMPVTPLVRDMLADLAEPARQARWIDRGAEVFGELLHEHRGRLRASLASRAPWWLPGALQHRVFDRFVDQLEDRLRDIRADPEHEARHVIAEWVTTTAARLETDGALIQRLEDEKRRLLDAQPVRDLVSRAVHHALGGLRATTDGTPSAVHDFIGSNIRSLGERLVAEPALRADVENQLSRAACDVLARFSGEIELLVSGTIERWNPQQLATQLEGLVGRDLQFIRINGTVVGAIAGLVIHTFSEAFS